MTFAATACSCRFCSGTGLPSFSAEELKKHEEKQPFEVALDKHELPEWLRALDGHKDDMTILHGISMSVSGGGHYSYSGCMGAYKAGRNILSNIKSFQGRLKMQQAVLSFISVHLLSTQEQEEMRKVFYSIDKDYNGVLDKHELVQGLEKLGHMNPQEEADRIFEMADLDQNGTIEFSEWVTATMD